MGIITISRIATQIIAVFSCDRDLDKIDLLEGDIQEKLEEMKNKIENFFGKRKINILNYFITCGERIEGFEDTEIYNDAVAEMILNITISH